MRKTLSRYVAVAAMVMACGGEKATEPSPQAAPPAALRLVFPDTVTRGQPFSLTVTALDALGQTNASWSGTVALTASAGAISPGTVNVVNGSATVQATIGQHAGAVSVNSSVGTATGSRSAMVLSGQPAARLEVHPSTFMLPGVGATQSLTARAFDDTGLPTAAVVTWESSRSSVATVSASGVASAASVGSASITARAGAIASDPALAYVTTPASGVVLVTDEQVSSITPVNPQARYGPGWQYRVRMTGSPPQVGQVVASRGEKPIAGRVIGVQTAGTAGADVTLQLVALDQVFTNLSIDETMPLRLEPMKTPMFQARTRAPWAAIVDDTLTVGPFKCEYKIDTADNNPFALSGITYDLTPTLQYNFVHSATRKRLVVQGGLTGSLKVTPTVTAALNGSFECKAEVGKIPIPIGGALGVFFGARIPLGLGFAFDGGITLATLGFDIELAAGTTVSMGYDCNPGCLNATVFSLTGSASGNVKPNLPQISSDFRVTAGVSGFLWADLEVGPSDLIPGAENLQFNLLESKAGLKEEFNLSTAEVQSADPGYASSYSLAPFFSGGVPSELQQAIDSLLGMAGIGLPPLNYEASGAPIAASPAGSFQIVPSRVRGSSASVPGDTATFIVNLSRTNYLTLYAVESVKLYHKPSPTGSLVPAPGACASLTPTSGQSLFTCKTTLPLSMAGDQNFYAFVKPILGGALPILLEVADDSKSTVTVDSADYFWDFTTGPPGAAWSTGQVSTSPSGQRFLGTFGTNGATELSVSALPSHQQLTLEFDIYIIESWNGNGLSNSSPPNPDLITISVVGGPILKRTTFSNRTADAQAFPGDYPGASNPAGTGSLARDALGYPGSNAGFGDSSYRIRLTFPHAAGTVGIRFASQQSSGDNERWGIDNVRVTIIP